MRRLLPSRIELLILFTLAIICTGVVSFIRPSAHDLGFAALAAPVFLIAAVMGLRRSPAWNVADDSDELAE